ncbi:MAG: peptide ABC transporter substrate-binding protein, partial [Alphaproteobacteria bacterium]|nr:peptide ABC transporter substrate-binding protein [Alphaproteobacteria bacterium]
MNPANGAVTADGAQDSKAKLGEVLVDVKNLKMYFPITEGVVFSRVVAEVKAVDDISFYINKGETLGLVGE